MKSDKVRKNTIESYIRFLLRSELFDADENLLDQLCDKIAFELMDRNLEKRHNNE